jgi:hypothetical protein
VRFSFEMLETLKEVVEEENTRARRSSKRAEPRRMSLLGAPVNKLSVGGVELIIR